MRALQVKTSTRCFCLLIPSQGTAMVRHKGARHCVAEGWSAMRADKPTGRTLPTVPCTAIRTTPEEASDTTDVFSTQIILNSLTEDKLICRGVDSRASGFTRSLPSGVASFLSVHYDGHQGSSQQGDLDISRGNPVETEPACRQVQMNSHPPGSSRDPKGFSPQPPRGFHETSSVGCQRQKVGQREDLLASRFK
jgi:hypothetical protein